jgi:hypothetical protein
VGLTNRRLLALDRERQTVTFVYKDYADGAAKRSMTLDLSEFIRRFRLHILPERFVKIRHYGFLANRNRQSRVAQARTALACTQAPTEQIGVAMPTADSASVISLICPHCHQPALKFVRVILPVRMPLPAYKDTS